ncbi:hypothetical protein AU381_00195 [Sinorhizobium glycinis]|uniref:Uncharacterized protein n=1 Tax=Sinorhizobium glycinis TaxID=1472378 RepID=A0A178Y243_9HYPH|nr:hypothetical protein [Sinorhizobium glycinis]OAP41527.1 hypothetical protein AU381_00195 [Sinorhizobium glycinis]
MTITGGKIRYKEGPEGVAIIFDHGAPIVFADLVTELEEINGVVRITFAALTMNGDGLHKAIVVARVRMPKDMAWQFCRALRELEG